MEHEDQMIAADDLQVHFWDEGDVAGGKLFVRLLCMVGGEVGRKVDAAASHAFLARLRAAAADSGLEEADTDRVRRIAMMTAEATESTGQGRGRGISMASGSAAAEESTKKKRTNN